MSQPLNVVIVEKGGDLKSLSIKDFKEEELYKKCGFKKADGFSKQAEWNAKYDGKKYCVKVFAKDNGRANTENKYDFPPPIDTKLFGSCAIIATVKNGNGSNSYVDLTLPLWNKMYEKLFGGFEDLAATAAEDEEEEDELANVPKEKKTKDGYLKDGFVVDSDDEEEDGMSCSDTEDEDEDDDDESDDSDMEESNTKETDIVIEDVGSELSEESYD